MTPTRVDPRAVAKTIGVDTFILAKTLRVWAGDKMDNALAALSDDFAEYDRLAVFDESVAEARVFLENSVAAEQAYYEDNPINEDDV